jgi:hypothetical protein
MTLTDYNELRKAVMVCESQVRGIHAAQIAAAQHREQQDEDILNLKARMGDLEDALAMLATMIDKAAETHSLDK